MVNSVSSETGVGIFRASILALERLQNGRPKWVETDGPCCFPTLPETVGDAALLRRPPVRLPTEELPRRVALPQRDSVYILDEPAAWAFFQPPSSILDNRPILAETPSGGIVMPQPAAENPAAPSLAASSPAAFYLAAPDFPEPLAEEMRLRGIAPLCRRDRLFGSAEPFDPAAPLAWAQDVWLNPEFLPIRSINHAAQSLRAIQRNWALFPLAHHRRAALIEARLPPMAKRPFRFGDPAPTAPLGAWALWEEDMLLFSSRRLSPFAHGEVIFDEDKTGPPSRAYLKLWEAFTLIGKKPLPGEFCLDLGSSPGGWTWALAQLGARVLSLDKAPLDPAVAALSGIEYRAESAFGFEPRQAGPVDWLRCDVACYPQRLYALIQRWLAEGNCRNFICTLKFQGQTDHATAAAFAAIPGSRLMHLHHNKHELTWVLLR